MDEIRDGEGEVFFNISVDIFFVGFVFVLFFSVNWFGKEFLFF